MESATITNIDLKEVVKIYSSFKFCVITSSNIAIFNDAIAFFDEKEINEKNICDYLLLQICKYKPSTVFVRYKYLIAAYNFAVRSGYLNINPFDFTLPIYIKKKLYKRPQPRKKIAALENCNTLNKIDFVANSF